MNAYGLLACGIDLLDLESFKTVWWNWQALLISNRKESHLYHAVCCSRAQSKTNLFRMLLQLLSFVRRMWMCACLSIVHNNISLWYICIHTVFVRKLCVYFYTNLILCMMLNITYSTRMYPEFIEILGFFFHFASSHSIAQLLYTLRQACWQQI